MVVKVYGHPFSTCTNTVLVTLKETNTPYELILVNLVGGEHKSAEYLEKQPFGQIPYLDDNGYIITESRAIARYIAAKAGSPLLPTGDLKKVTAFETAASIETSNFEPFARGIGFQRVVAPIRGETTDEELVASHIKTLESKLAGYERILSKQRYLAGDEITLADLFHLPNGQRLVPAGITWLEDGTKFPNVTRWWKDISSRDSWKQVAADIKPPQRLP